MAYEQQEKKQMLVFNTRQTKYSLLYTYSFNFYQLIFVIQVKVHELYVKFLEHHVVQPFLYKMKKIKYKNFLYKRSKEKSILYIDF